MRPAEAHEARADLQLGQRRRLVGRRRCYLEGLGQQAVAPAWIGRHDAAQVGEQLVGDDAPRQRKAGQAARLGAGKGTCPATSSRPASTSSLVGRPPRAAAA